MCARTNTHTHTHRLNNTIMNPRSSLGCLSVQSSSGVLGCHHRLVPVPFSLLRSFRQKIKKKSVKSFIFTISLETSWWLTLFRKAGWPFCPIADGGNAGGCWFSLSQWLQKHQHVTAMTGFHQTEPHSHPPLWFACILYYYYQYNSRCCCSVKPQQLATCVKTRKKCVFITFECI